MTATSASGTGLGSADRNSKASEHAPKLDLSQLIGFHPVTGGVVVLSGGSATVTFPQSLASTKDKYIVMITSLASYARLNTKTDDGDTKFASFTITGTGTDTVQWAVFKLDV